VTVQRLVLKILGGIIWPAPVGAFGAIAGVVGAADWSAIGSLGMLVCVFYATCAVFVVVILGAIPQGHHRVVHFQSCCTTYGRNTC